MFRLLVAALMALSTAPPASAAPSRIVSLNLCTDILLFKLADRPQIASLSFLAADRSLSVIADQVKGIPLNYGRVEEVRLIDPDLVLAGEYGARFAVSVLKQHGYKVVQIPAVTSLDQVAPAIERLGEVIGRSETARGLASDVRNRLARLAQSRQQPRLSAVIFQPRGFAAGRPTLADDVLTLAGARNRAADTGFADWVPLGVEGLLNLDPDIAVIDSDEERAPALSYGVFRHRALRVFDHPHRMVRIPTKLWTCGIPETVDAAEQLRLAFAQVRP